MQLQCDHTSLNLIEKTDLFGVAALSDEAKVEGQLIACLHHLSDVLLARGAIDSCR
jgi:hypothetical protein